MHLEREGIFLGKDHRIEKTMNMITNLMFRGYSLFLCSRNYLGSRTLAQTGTVINHSDIMS